MTPTPTIREAFLDAFYAMSRVSTNIKNLSDIDAEIAALSGTAPFAVALLTTERARVASRIKEYEDDAIRTAAARLCLRTDDSGGCDIDLPAKRPAGRPTKTEAAARAKVGSEATPAPTSPTGDPAADAALATAADAFMAAIADDRTPGQVRLVLSDLDWAVDEMSQYSDTALAYAAKHGLGPSQVTRMDDGGMRVDATGEVIP